MQQYPEELIVPPSPFIALVSDAPTVDLLAVALKSAPASPVGLGAALAQRVRYEPRPTTHVFPRKEHTHAPAEYDTYVPGGILRWNWMAKHQNEVPAVMVREEEDDRTISSLPPPLPQSPLSPLSPSHPSHPPSPRRSPSFPWSCGSLPGSGPLSSPSPCP
jgi:hypothetical protein